MREALPLSRVASSTSRRVGPSAVSLRGARPLALSWKKWRDQSLSTRPIPHSRNSIVPLLLPFCFEMCAQVLFSHPLPPPVDPASVIKISIPPQAPRAVLAVGRCLHFLSPSPQTQQPIESNDSDHPLATTATLSLRLPQPRRLPPKHSAHCALRRWPHQTTPRTYVHPNPSPSPSHTSQSKESPISPLQTSRPRPIPPPTGRVPAA